MIVHQYAVCDMERQMKLYDYEGVSKSVVSQVPVPYKPLLPEIDQRRLHHIRELYYQQHECLSAYQLMQHRHTADENAKRYLVFFLSRHTL